MADESSGSNGPSSVRGRGRGKSRGGLGKYLRARGRGGRGRPAEFTKRLALDDEEETELDVEEAKALERKYARRQLGSNADRYVEPEPDLNSDGEVEEEPEVDLSKFLARQRLDGDTDSVDIPGVPQDDGDEVDESLSHLLRGNSQNKPRKGQVVQVEWDDELDALNREKSAADASRDLKNRFRTKVEKQRLSGSTQNRVSSKAGTVRSKDAHVELPPLPTDQPSHKSEKNKMEEFLDDLLG